MPRLRMFEEIVIEEELTWPVTPDALAGFVNRVITKLYHEKPAGLRKEIRLQPEGFRARVDGGTLSLRLVLEIREDA